MRGTIGDGSGIDRRRKLNHMSAADLRQPRTQIMLNLAHPDMAFGAAQLPSAGVGLARLEFIIGEEIGLHPMAAAHPERVASAPAREAVSTHAIESTAPAFVVPGTGIVARELGPTDYKATWHAMQAFTDARDAATPDEIWLTSHAPVYTLGLAGRREHLLRDNGIPTLKVDRGGQVTYHGPGQLVAYLLVDLCRRRLGVRGERLRAAWWGDGGDARLLR